MTPDESTRLAVIETKVEAVERDVKGIRTDVREVSAKLDRFAETKADCTELDAVKASVDAAKELAAAKVDADDFGELRTLLITILLASAGFAITTLVALAIWAFQTLATHA